MCKTTWGQIWPQRGKIEILEKRLSLTAQNHYADLEDTCRDKVTKFGVTERYIKKVIEKKRRLGSNLTPGGLLRVKRISEKGNGMYVLCDDCWYKSCLVVTELEFQTCLYTPLIHKCWIENRFVVLRESNSLRRATARTWLLQTTIWVTLRRIFLLKLPIMM